MSFQTTGVHIEHQPTFLAQPTLSFLLAYWDLKRGERPMPTRADLSPAEMKEHLGWIVLLDVMENDADFRFRTVGTRVCEYFQGDPTGRTVREAFAVYGDAAVSAVVATHAKVAQAGQALRVHGGGGLFGREFLDFDALYLPLSGAGGNVNMILSAFTFDRAALLGPGRG